MSFDPKIVVERSKAHLHEVDETYWQHMGFALYALWMLLSAAVFLIIHILVPAWFPCSAGERILKLADQIKSRREKAGCQTAA